MDSYEIPPAWRMPEGVNSALWEYTHSKRLADDEPDYFAGHPMHKQDEALLDARFLTPGLLVDLGCGVGRHSERFARRGFPTVAIDLSQPMLKSLADRTEGLPLLPLEANLCRLSCLPTATFDYGLSMFSTLGMIRGRSFRRQALAEAARIIKPGGRLALHAHNFWLEVRDSQGRKWLAGELVKLIKSDPDLGDRRFNYRGVVGMEVHLYRWGELIGELREAGFRVEERISVDERTAEPIHRPWFLSSIRAGGWVVFARRDEKVG